ncbi:DUF5685 family protein [Konateibacter massiliensis]|uniref:DUF5685 family protein n=1 Tax=Konateibacter massiliensis TaxID=2002841 RepID=UPI000C1467C3|nr:DUF5685 family protein [Konateibacter massiliensis]
MFGYVTVNKPELKIKEYNRYHAYYCGLCHTLKERHGFIGQMTLTYDMTFLVLLLTSLYESSTSYSQKHCIVHPVKKHELLINEITAYAADMNIALAYHHFLDDWSDEKKVNALAGAAVLKKKYLTIEKQYPRQCEVIASSLKKLQEYEAANEKSLDFVSGCFGTLMAELFAYKQDVWEENLRRLGFFLGKYIYLIDAYFDLEDDIKNKSYNPLIFYKEQERYEEFCFEMLTLMISEAANEFEKLPCVLDVEILRNILYGGVWSKYNSKKQKTERT